MQIDMASNLYIITWQQVKGLIFSYSKGGFLIDDVKKDIQIGSLKRDLLILLQNSVQNCISNT